MRLLDPTLILPVESDTPVRVKDCSRHFWDSTTSWALCHEPFITPSSKSVRHGGAAPVAVDVELEDGRSMDQPIDGRHGHGVIGEAVLPGRRPAWSWKKHGEVVRWRHLRVEREVGPGVGSRLIRRRGAGFAQIDS